MVARAISLALLLAVLPLMGGAHAQDAPSGWREAWGYLVENICVDARDRPLPGVSPLDAPAACPQQRKLAVGERLPYHKRDWPGVADRAGRPEGYQQSDSYPVLTSLGEAVVQTYDFGDQPRAFGRFDAGDGGQVAFFSANAAAFGITEDGGAGLQFFIGPGCQPLDSWVVVDSSFTRAPMGQTVARLTRQQAACPAHLGAAFTRWRVQPVTYRDRVQGAYGQVTLQTLVSEHFGGADVAGADHLERMYFTQQLGYTRWERWQNLAVHDRAADRAQAAVLAESDRCDAGVGPPAPGAAWVLIDCRAWTQMARPTDVAGDPADFWLDRLRSYAATKPIFLP